MTGLLKALAQYIVEVEDALEHDVTDKYGRTACLEYVEFDDASLYFEVLVDGVVVANIAVPEAYGTQNLGELL